MEERAQRKQNRRQRFTVGLARRIWTMFIRRAITACMSAFALAIGAQAAFGQKPATAPSPVPPEVRYKSGYVNPAPRPDEFRSAMLWGIAIADTRVPGHEKATVEIASTQLSCRVNGKDVVVNDDAGAVRGGLYRRVPWFDTDTHAPMPLRFSKDGRAIVLDVGSRAEAIWHFWAASPRAVVPVGQLDGCTVKVRARISHGALLQVGFDYWRDATAEYGSGGNNHEAGASDWYFPAAGWQDAVFSDIDKRGAAARPVK